MDSKILENILEEIKITNKLMAISITRGLKSVEEQVDLLSQAGLQPKDVGEILGKTTHYVSVVNHKLRKVKESNRTEQNGKTNFKPKNPKKAK